MNTVHKQEILDDFISEHKMIHYECLISYSQVSLWSHFIKDFSISILNKDINIIKLVILHQNTEDFFPVQSTN